MVDRLGWTLVHFVWEGTLVAALLAMALLFGRRSTSEFRYALALGALALMAALPLATFVALAPSGLTLVEAGAQQPTLGETIVAGAPTVARMPVLVGLWCVGVAILSLRLMGTVIHLERWRRRNAQPAPAPDQAKLDTLARRLGLRRRVALLISEHIEVPSAWGVFRPVVVVPLGLLTGLPPAQVEGILLHELAHVRRHDYLVNLLQGVVETALFYHPAVWWVSSVVRREREHLCDDVAVAVLGDPIPYARALLHLEECRQAPRPALSAKEGNLMNRIARILSSKPAPARLSPLAPSLAALAVVAFAFGGVLRAEAQSNKPLSKRNGPKGKSGGKDVGRKPSRKSSDWTPFLDPSTGRWNDGSRGVLTYAVPISEARRPASSLRRSEQSDAEPQAFGAKRASSTPAPASQARAKSEPRAETPEESPAARALDSVPVLKSASAASGALSNVPVPLRNRNGQPAGNPESAEAKIWARAGRIVEPAQVGSQVDSKFFRGGQVAARGRIESIDGQAAQAQGRAETKVKQDDESTKLKSYIDKAIAERRAASDRARAELYRKFAQGKSQSLFGKEGQSYRFMTPKTFTLPKDFQGLKQVPSTPLFANPEALRQLYRGNDFKAYTLFGDAQVDVSNGGKVSIDVPHSSFVGVVRSLARKAKLSVVIARGSYNDVSLVVSDRSPADALSILCKAAGASCRSEGGVYYIAPEKGLKVDSTGSTQNRTLVLNGGFETHDVLVEEERLGVASSTESIGVAVGSSGRVFFSEPKKV